MLSLNQDRVTDMSFFLDDDFVIHKPNRNFLRLVNVTDEVINLKDIIVSQDIEKLKNAVRAKAANFVSKIFAREKEMDVLFVFEYNSNLIEVNMLLLNNIHNVQHSLLMKTKEYETLLTSLDCYYWIYDSSDETVVFKNTRELGVLFQGKFELFHDFIVNYFNIKDYNRVKDNLVYDLANGWANKTYKFSNKENDGITLKTKMFDVKGRSYYIGCYTFDNDIVPEGHYIEKRDGLTGVYNKNTIVDIVHNHIDAKIEFSLAVIDIDRFKIFNDTFGHAYGDKVIVTVANVIKDSVKGFGYVGRIGGDEFLCIIEKTDEEALRTVVRDIRLGVQWALPANTTDSVVTCSIGIARYPMNVNNYDELFDLADKCLYIAKNKGRNCYVIYKPNIHDSIIQQAEELKGNAAISREFYNNVKDQYAILEAIDNNDPNLYEMLAKYICVDKITIYDEYLNLSAIIGDKSKEPRRNFIKRDDYFKYYNNYGYFLMDNTNVLDTLDKEKFDMYLSDNIATSLEVIKKDRYGNIIGVICYDKYKPAKTFQEDKIKFALFISDLLLK